MSIPISGVLKNANQSSEAIAENKNQPLSYLRYTTEDQVNIYVAVDAPSFLETLLKFSVSAQTELMFAIAQLVPDVGNFAIIENDLEGTKMPGIKVFRLSGGGEKIINLAITK